LIVDSKWRLRLIAMNFVLLCKDRCKVKEEKMKQEPILIKLYNKGESATETMYVEQIGNDKFRMIENALFNCRLTLGTECETRINKEGKHELIQIIKESDFITRRFLLTNDFKEADYRILGDELIKRGGFWQVDMGGIATVNMPKDFAFDIDQVIIDLDLGLTEIVED